MMRSAIERTLTNPWILWSLFGAGFFMPYLFVLFLPSITILAWRHIVSEYRDISGFWIKQSNTDSLDRKKEIDSETNHAKPPMPALSPVSL